MRVEDLDGPRTRPEAVFGNLAELRWLGLDWDEGPDVGGPHAPYRQSERHHRYQEALDELAAAGHLFECYLSRKDLASAASAPHESTAGEGAYGAAERELNRQVAAAKIAAGKPASLRFAVPDEIVSFDDGLLGAQRIAAASVGDFVVRRADGQWAYQLAVVIDDAAMGITEVVRGADLLRATVAQLLLYRALGLTPPAFAHLPLLVGSDGERLAKRRGSLTLHELQGAGVRPERVVGLLAFGLGLLERLGEASAAELSSAFTPTRVAREPSVLDEGALRWLLAGSSPPA